MDRPFLGLLLLGVAFLPYMIEVMLQVRLQARFLAALSEQARSSLPPHPRNPWLAFLGSLRFQLALWRYVRRHDPDDSVSIATLKRRMRLSLRRELVWAIGALVVLAAFVVAGWRPPYP